MTILIAAIIALSVCGSVLLVALCGAIEIPVLMENMADDDGSE